MTNVFRDVQDFANAADSPNYLRDGEKFLDLARKLIVEEVDNEFLPAFDKWRQNPSLENLCNALDGALDSIYVLAFWLNQMGFPAEEFWKKLQRFNMAKFPGGVAIKDPVTGKVQKPAGWKPPEWYEELIEWQQTLSRHGQYVGGVLQSPALRQKSEPAGIFSNVPLAELPICEYCDGRGAGHYFTCPVIKGEAKQKGLSDENQCVQSGDDGRSSTGETREQHGESVLSSANVSTQQPDVAS